MPASQKQQERDVTPCCHRADVAQLGGNRHRGVNEPPPPSAQVIAVGIKTYRHGGWLRNIRARVSKRRDGPVRRSQHCSRLASIHVKDPWSDRAVQLALHADGVGNELAACCGSACRDEARYGLGAEDPLLAGADASDPWRELVVVADGDAGAELPVRADIGKCVSASERRVLVFSQ